MRKPKKKVEQKLEIPECLRNQLIVVRNNPDGSPVADILLMSMEEIDVTKQASNLKKATDVLKRLLSDNSSHHLTDTCLQVLSYIFMDCDGKNPCRRTIASFFQGLSGCMWKQALEHLNGALIKTLGEVKPDENFNFRKYVDTVCSLLENFQMGEKCVSVNLITVLEFLMMSLESQVVRESLVGTPALQTAAMLDCLVTIKAVIGVVQKCNEEVTKALNHNHMLAELLQRFLKVILKILKNDAFFPDCRSAAGMAFPLIIRVVTSEENLVPTIVSLIFPTYMKQPVSNEQLVSSHWISTTVHFQSIKDLSGFSYLSVCRGVMTMLAREVLVTRHNSIHSKSPDDCGTLLLDVLFPEITSLCSKLKDSSSLVAFRTLACWTSETREAISNVPDDNPLKSRLVGTSDILQTLLNFVWNYWDHPLEAMRYHTREIFDNVLKMHIIGSGNEPISDPFLEELARKLCKMDYFVRGKYGPLCCLVNMLGAQAILNIQSTIPVDVMAAMCDQSIVPHATEFAEKMFQCHVEQLSKETDQYLEDWFRIWIVPGLRSLSSGGKIIRKHVTEYYIPRLLKCCPQSLHLIVRELQEPTGQAGHGSDNVGCLVTCLKIARHLGILPRAELLMEEEEDMKESWHGIISVAVLDQSLCHLDDEVRCDTLGLICDSVRTTEPLTRKDIELLKKFYPANMNSQSPSFRQRALGMTKKLFVRLRDGGRSLKKKVSERNCGVDVLAAQLNVYIEFLHWFARLQFGSLFPGASFPRRTTALQNLNLMLQMFSENLKSEDPYSIFECSEVFSTRTVHILLDCLKDTYDMNKQMAFDLLVACTSTIQPFADPAFALEWTITATQLAVSPKAVNVSTAAYMFKLLIRKSPHEIILPSADETSPSVDDTNSGFSRNSQGDSKSSKESKHYDNFLSSGSEDTVADEQADTRIPCEQTFRVLSQLVKRLQDQVDVARKSLLQAAFEAPIHGVLYCMRETICDFELKDVAGNKLWQSLVRVILQACYDVADTVSPVVTNASPEGNMMESNDLANSGDDFVDQEGYAPKAQILLVCCWRAMKEVSLLLGEITKRAPVKEKGQDYGLLSFEEFNVIGELFTNILLTSKHRGAYELAHEGFVKLCHTLWRCKQRELQCLPEKLLVSLLSDISSDTPTPWLCGTRRSAGLPFFFKAIITTEPSTTGKSCFKAVMRELLNTAAKVVTPQESNKDTTLPQVHARNILRAMYKETKLGEDVYPYVAEGVQIAVEGFLSVSWAVRNSSTLLFSALMNRMFGPEKFQEERRKKGMTGREFFSRFPSLHSFLIKQLEISLDNVEGENSKSIQLYPSLYPVLLLLSRLHPSAMDGNDSTLNMAAFIPYVLRCSKSRVLKTRAMAARALVPLVSGEALPGILKCLLERLPENWNKSVCQNQVHGCLLQIQELLNNISMNTSLSAKTKEAASKTFTPLLLKRKWLASNRNPCGMTRAVFLCLFRKFVMDQTWFTGESQTTTSSLSNVHFSSEIQSVIDCAVDEVVKGEEIKLQLFAIGRTFVKEEIARIALQPVYGNFCGGNIKSTDVSCILALLSTSDYEVTLVTLEFLHQVFVNCRDVTVCGSQLDVIVKELLRHVVNFTMESSCLSQLYKCLSLVPRSLEFPWNLGDDGVVKLSEGWRHVLLACQQSGQRSEIKCSLLEFSGVLVGHLREEASRENSKESAIKILEEWVSFVEACAGNEESEILRLTVSHVICSGSVSFLLMDINHVYEYIPFRLWKLVVSLLVDDSIDVKTSMAAGLSKVFQVLTHVSLLGSPKYCSVHAAFALQYAIRKPIELSWAQMPVSCLLWLLSLIGDGRPNALEDEVDACGESAYDDMESIDRLFEKGPINTYYEDCILAEIVLTTLTNWADEHRDSNSLLPQGSQLLLHLQTFVKNFGEKCDETLPQNLLYSNIYKTMTGLAMMKIIHNSVLLDESQEATENLRALEVFNKAVSTLKEMRTRDRGHCFHHSRLQELAQFVLGD